MYCAKCHYHAQDHLKACPKCNAPWDEARKALGLAWLEAEGFSWLTVTPPTAPLDADILDVDHILAPPAAEPQPGPTPTTQQTPVIDINDLPAFTTAPAAPPEASAPEELPAPPPVAAPEPLPEIEVDLPPLEPAAESESSPELGEPVDLGHEVALDPLEQVTPEESFLQQLSADMPASDHILLAPAPAMETAAAELDLVLELEDEPVQPPTPPATATPPQAEAPAAPSAQETLFIPELEELLGPPSPPASEPSPTPPPAAETPPAEDDFAIILLDDDEKTGTAP